MEPIKREGCRVIYSVPEGAEYRLLPDNPTYIMACSHPHSRPWLVTHEGKEVPLIIDINWNPEAPWIL